MRINLCLPLLASSFLCAAQDAAVLPGTQPLTLEGDLSAQMVAGIDAFLSREIEQSIAERQKLWHRDFSSPEAYEKSIEPNRGRLRKMIGATDLRLPSTALELLGSTTHASKIAETEAFTVHAVRWPVFEGVFGEGLWLQAKPSVRARVIAIPDADQTPEMLVGLSPGLAPERQFARRLAENGCEVLVPVLLDRHDTWSGNPRLKRFTNQPHREWIYRQAYEMGHHIIGYEVQKILAAVDWFKTEVSSRPAERPGRIGIIGSTEGGLVALYSAALDPRIDAVVTSGYFESRQDLWQEPIYRNVFGLLTEFGDAELASLIAPRKLIVEHSSAPKVDGPPKPHDGRSGAAPGKIQTAEYSSVEGEFQRARELLKPGAPKIFDCLKLLTGAEGMTTGPGSDWALTELLNALGIQSKEPKPPGKPPIDSRDKFDPGDRQQRQVKELEDFTQKLCTESEKRRAEFFWNNLKPGSPEQWQSASARF